MPSCSALVFYIRGESLRRLRNYWVFFSRLDFLYHHAKIGEDCDTSGDCRCENVVFFTLGVRGGA